MKTRTVLILGVAAVCIALLAALAIRMTAEPPVGEDRSHLLPGFAAEADRAAQIEITTAAASLRLVRDDGGWTLPDKTGIAAQTDKVRALLIGLAELTPGEAKTSNPDNYARVGVDDPAAGAESGSRATLVTVRDAGGDGLASLILGDMTDAGRFVRVPGEAKSYLAEVGFDVSTETTLWTDRTLLRVDGDRVSSVVIAHPDGEEFAVTRASPDVKNFGIVPMPGGRVLRNPSIATPISRALAKLMFEDVRPGTAALDPAKTVSVVYQTFDGLVVSLLIGDADGERWAAITVSAADTAHPPPDYEDLRRLVTDRQFRLPPWAAGNMTKHLSDFLAPEGTEPVPGPAPGPVPGPPGGPGG